MILVPSKNSVRKAGIILRRMEGTDEEIFQAIDILSDWRALHSYPIKSFRAFFERHIRQNSYDNPIIAQRLKRLPSIVYKLRRFPSMALERMQDIGGIRIILKDNNELERLYEEMMKAKFPHKPILPPHDYISEPKPDGYRSLHQVYQYHNTKHPELNCLNLEVQLRTKVQHAWATAVETLGIVERSSFKTGEGSGRVKQFFKLSSAIFSLY